MKPICMLLGCDWEIETNAPDPRWNTTKDGLVLEATSSGDVQHFRYCKRCGKREAIDPPIREKTAPAVDDSAAS